MRGSLHLCIIKNTDVGGKKEEKKKRGLLMHQQHFWIWSLNKVKNNVHVLDRPLPQDSFPHRIVLVSPWDPGTWCSRPCPHCRARPGWWCCRSQTWSAGALQLPLGHSEDLHFPLIKHKWWFILAGMQLHTQYFQLKYYEQYK